MAFLPALAAIASLVAGGVSAGEGIASLVNKPSMPKPPTTGPPAPTGPTPAQQRLQQQEQQVEVAQQLPNIDASTSGFANPAYEAMLASLRSGTAGQPGGDLAANRAVAQAFGLQGFPGVPPLTVAGATANNAVPPSTTALSDFTNSFFRG